MKFRNFFCLTTIAILGFSLFSQNLYSQKQQPSKAPLTEEYTAQDRVRSGIAHGGIGTGSVELRKDGQFYNWTIFNNQPLSTGPLFQLRTNPLDSWRESLQFFIVRYQEEGKEAKLKLLQLNQSLSEGAMESIDYYFPWMTAIEKIEYSARFPFTWITFTDSEMPLKIELEAFSPFIPNDVKNSSLPGVYFNFKITSLSEKNIKVMLVASQRNLVGYDVIEKYFVGELEERPGFKFFEQTAGGMDTTASSFGQMGMASVSDSSTYYIGWEHKHPYYEYLLVDDKLRNINDADNRNKTDKISGKKLGNYSFGNKDQRMFSSIAISHTLSPEATLENTFIMTWFFPNNYGSYNDKNTREKELDYSSGQKLTKKSGHYYNNYFNSAANVADYMVKEQKLLTSKTKKFMDDMYQSDIDLFVLDQINSHLNTLIISTVLTKDMKFGIREGITSDKSWGPNNTSDVALYGSIMTISLFPELQKSAMRSHRNLQTEKGEINHGLGFDLDYNQNGTWGVYDRIDLPGNYIQMVLRDYFLTNDTAYLNEMWPSVKKAIDYVLAEKDKNKDLMPEMNGIMCSYDNFPMYGLSSYIQSQWVCSLTAAAIAAEKKGDMAAEKKYKKIAQSGSALMDKYLWNGKYFRLSNDYDSTTGNKGTDEGCLTDQIIGQWIAHQCGLPYLFKKENVKTALGNIMDLSYKPDFGLRNCSWPQYPGIFPIHETDLWVDQANTCWTGVELAFASFLIYEGLVKEAYDVIRTVDNRYRRANLYFDHQEFGGHYFRPMSAWGIINAMLGLQIHCGTYTFDPKLTQDSFTLFFAFPGGTAHYIKSQDAIEIKVLSGEWRYNKLVLLNTAMQSAVAGDKKSVSEGNSLVFNYGKEIVVRAGNSVSIKAK